MILTSGASEALAIGLGRAKAKRRIVSAVEHDAVFRAAPDATIVPMGSDGRVDGPALSAALRAAPEQALVAIQHVNSETGTPQDIDAIAIAVDVAGGVLMCDAAQSGGRYDLPCADMIVVSAHKCGGPPGVGALLVRDLGLLEASGGQERGYRGGTENLPGALGFAAALEVSDRRLDADTLDALDHLRKAVEMAGGAAIRLEAGQMPHIQPLAMPRLSATAQLVQFDLAGFAVSAGSACSSGSLKPSRALAAFGIAPDLAARTIRVSIGWNTTGEEVRAFTEAWLKIAEAARARAA